MSKKKIAEDVTVSSFCIERHEVTNAQFAKFVKAIGYVTIAERPLSKEQFPNLSDDERSPGSLVFKPPEKGIQLAYPSWWQWTPGANWRHPFGPDSDIQGKADHPVVHIAYEDAVAYADWAGRELPSEAQWEYAARGGKEGWTYAWGEQYAAKQANTWQGLFPFFNTKEDGHVGTAPVMSFPPNGYGLHDMTGNVWELTSTWFTVQHDDIAHNTDPAGPSRRGQLRPEKTDGWSNARHQGRLIPMCQKLLQPLSSRSSRISSFRHWHNPYRLSPSEASIRVSTALKIP